MIKIVRECSIDESNRLKLYLQNTPVAGLVQYIHNGILNPHKGIVDSIDVLGNLKTEFGNIDNKSSMEIYNRNKFLVKELYPLLTKNPQLDPDMLDSINYFRKNWNNLNDKIITVLKVNDEFCLKDGDKRAIAFYENQKEKSNNQSLEIILLKE